MKYILLVLVIVITLTGCMTLDERALNAGYIKASDCPTVPEPAERSPLPHPLIPIFEMADEDGVYQQPTMNEVLELVIKYGATISKFQYLVEIYEREYLNIKGSSLFENLSIEELRIEYLIRIGKITNPTPIDTSGFTTGAAIAKQTDEKIMQDYLTMVEYMNLTNIKYNEKQ